MAEAIVVYVEDSLDRGQLFYQKCLFGIMLSTDLVIIVGVFVENVNFLFERPWTMHS